MTKILFSSFASLGSIKAFFFTGLGFIGNFFSSVTLLSISFSKLIIEFGWEISLFFFSLYASSLLNVSNVFAVLYE